jgi:hypothetical protein
MILGMSVSAFTTLHVVISLIAMVAGVAVVVDFLRGRERGAWTVLFLATTFATSATGFLFHSEKIGPPHVVGFISFVILAVAAFALYVRQLQGAWRWIYVVSALVTFYLNVFVGVVQAFQKLPVLHAVAPTQTEPAFVAAQLLVLIVFIALGVLAVRRFHSPAGARLAAGG